MKFLSTVFLSASLVAASISVTQAQINPPTVRTVKPLGATPGATVKLTIEGIDLDQASSLIFEGCSPRCSIEKSLRDRIEASVALPADMRPGPLAFRVVSRRGLSNSGRIDVSRGGPTLSEAEPNNGFHKAQVVKSPCTIEGNIRDGMDVDVFAIDLHEGEILVADVRAARIGSTLDPLVTIYSSDGRELASDDDLFGRDAAVSVRVPRDGRYFIEVLDANGRNSDGKEEAKLQGNRIYRMSLGAGPWLVSVDPAGVRRGVKTPVSLSGIAVPRESVIDLAAGSPLGDFSFNVEGSNPINLRVGDSPEVREVEPNDRTDQVASILIPATINGTFERKEGGDNDLFRIKPTDEQAGDYAITAYAARVGSPADPVLSLLGDGAQTLVEDDDKLGRDARIEQRIEPAGRMLGIREFYGRGGPRFVYRIEIEPIAPVSLKVDLGGRTLPRHGRIALPIVVERHGYNGPVTLSTGPLPAGVSSSTITIAARGERGVLLLSAEATAKLGAFGLKVIARDGPGRITWSFFDSSNLASLASAHEEEPLIAIADPAPLDVTVEPRELIVTAGEASEMKVHLKRGADVLKSTVKVGFTPTEGDMTGLVELKEESFTSDRNERVISIKAKPDALARRFSLVARARFDKASEAQSVVSNPIGVDVRPKAKLAEAK